MSSPGDPFQVALDTYSHRDYPLYSQPQVFQQDPQSLGDIQLLDPVLSPNRWMETCDPWVGFPSQIRHTSMSWSQNPPQDGPWQGELHHNPLFSQTLSEVTTFTHDADIHSSNLLLLLGNENAIINKKKNGGRIGGLGAKSRERAALIRKLGACWRCRLRKIPVSFHCAVDNIHSNIIVQRQ